MSKEKTSFEALRDYIPDGSFDMVLAMILHYKVQLTVTKERKTLLGTYHAPIQNKGHRISVNATLNKYAFLVTLLHELAHLVTFQKYRHKVPPHGREWKDEFGLILKSYLQAKIFPSVIEKALSSSLVNAAASSCGDEKLFLALKQFDKIKPGKILVDHLEEGAHFKLDDGRQFIRETKLRKRIKCREVSSGKYYLFSKLYEVTILNHS